MKGGGRGRKSAVAATVWVVSGPKRAKRLLRGMGVLGRGVVIQLRSRLASRATNIAKV